MVGLVWDTPYSHLDLVIAPDYSPDLCSVTPAVSVGGGPEIDPFVRLLVVALLAVGLLVFGLLVVGPPVVGLPVGSDSSVFAVCVVTRAMGIGSPAAEQYEPWTPIAAVTCGASTAVEHLLATQAERKAPAVLARAALHRHALSQGGPQPMPGIRPSEDGRGGLQTHCCTQLDCKI